MRALAFCLFATAAFAQDGGLNAAVTFSEGLAAPASVLYDADTDTYLVSNINGAPLAKDNNGFLSELSPDGKVVNLKLIEGGKKKVKLNAPRGFALKDGVLYVADLDTVRMFDRKTGAPKGEVALKGATFANDVALGPDGNLYVSDTSLNAKLESTGGDAIWVVIPGKKPTARALVKSPALHGPDGLLVTRDSLIIVCFGAPELQTFDFNRGGKGVGLLVGLVSKMPSSGLGGIVAAGEDLLVSSSTAKAIFRGALGYEFREAITGLEAPGDLGFDPRRNRVLVPRMKGNTVEAWQLE